MAAPGFLEVYRRGALVAGDFLGAHCVLIGQSPGYGWGAVPAGSGPLDSVVTYPLDQDVADPGLVFVHFPLSLFDDSDETVAACPFTFEVDGELGEIVWPDPDLIRNLVPTSLADALTAEVAAPLVAVPPGQGEQVPAGGRGGGVAVAGRGALPGAGRGSGRVTVATLSSQLQVLADSMQGVLGAVSDLGARMDQYDRRADPPLIGDLPVAGRGVDMAGLRAEAGGLPGLGVLGAPPTPRRVASLVPEASLVRPAAARLPPHLRAPAPVVAPAAAPPPGLPARPGHRPSGSSGDGGLESAIREQTAAIVALGRRRRTTLDTDEGDDEDEDEARLPGARGATALQNLQTVLARNPGYFTQGVAKGLLRSVSHHPGVTATPTPCARGYVAQEVGFGTHRTLGYLTWGLATVWDELQQGNVASAHATVSLLLVAAEQCAVDDGRWPLAWLLSLLPEPPWATMMRRRESMPLRPFGRLADARWIAAAAGYVRDMDKLNAVRKTASAWPADAPSPPGAPGGGKGKDPKGKGKDKDAAGA